MGTRAHFPWDRLNIPTVRTVRSARRVLISLGAGQPFPLFRLIPERDGARIQPHYRNAVPGRLAFPVFDPFLFPGPSNAAEKLDENHKSLHLLWNPCIR